MATFVTLLCAGILFAMVAFIDVFIYKQPVSTVLGNLFEYFDTGQNYGVAAAAFGVLWAAYTDYRVWKKRAAPAATVGGDSS